MNRYDFTMSCSLLLACNGADRVYADGAGAAGADGGASSGRRITFPCQGVVPATTLITDFNDLVSTGTTAQWGAPPVNGGVFVYGATSPPAFDVSRDDLAVFGNITASTGFGIYFETCTDASRFKGIRFSIHGSVLGDRVTFALATNKMVLAGDGRGECLAAPGREFVDCISPWFEMNGVTTTPRTVDVTWATLGGGVPAPGTTMGEDILGLQWAFPDSPSAEAYPGELVIDDLSFIE